MIFVNDAKSLGNHIQPTREPREQAEHMAAPTTAARVKKALANPEPSTHGPSRPTGGACNGSVSRRSSALTNIMLQQKQNC
jgi:hypothetical protein